LPSHADLKAAGADALSPHFTQGRLGRKIGDRSRNRIEPGAKCGKLLIAICASNCSSAGVESTNRTLAFEERSRRSLGGHTNVVSTPAAAIKGK
jgi:hypothetical protein